MREPPSKCLPPRGTNNQSRISERNNSNQKTKNDTEASAVILVECLSAPVRQSSHLLSVSQEIINAHRYASPC